MINDENYVQKSLEIDLIVTRFMYDHALMLEILLSLDDENFIVIYEEEKEEYRKMHHLLLDLANGRVSQTFLDSDSLITDYTSFLEEKTRELYKKQIDPSLNSKALLLTSGNIQATEELTETVTKLNLRLLDMLEKSKENLLLLDNHLKNRTTIVTEDYIKHFIEETDLFIYVLEHLVNRTASTPTFAYKSTYHFSELMKDHGDFLKNLMVLDESISDNLNNFLVTYQNLLNSFDNEITPTKMNELFDKSLFITKKYKELIEDLLKDSIDKNYIEKIVSIYIDHIIREANYTLATLEFLKSDQF